jgi:crossover junction endodeoxyribonuclease RuvC
VKRLLTGSGKASKEQVQYAIQHELGLDHILEPNDVADAFAVALCHYHSTKSMITLTSPQAKSSLRPN